MRLFCNHIRKVIFYICNTLHIFFHQERSRTILLSRHWYAQWWNNHLLRFKLPKFWPTRFRATCPFLGSYSHNEWACTSKQFPDAVSLESWIWNFSMLSILKSWIIFIFVESHCRGRPWCFPWGFGFIWGSDPPWTSSCSRCPSGRWWWGWGNGWCLNWIVNSYSFTKNYERIQILYVLIYKYRINSNHGGAFHQNLQAQKEP